MSTKVIGPSTTKIELVRVREKLVNFEPDRVSAPFALRCGGLAADYLIFVMLPAAFMLLSRAYGNDGPGLLTSGLNDIGWVTGTLIGFVSIVLLPLATGRTLGKMITGLRVVTIDGTEPSVKQMLVRQVLAVLLFPFTLGISFFWAALSPRGRALHDYLAGTIVIYADKSSN